MEKFNDFVRKHKKKIFWWCFSISIASIVLLFIINLEQKMALVTIFLASHALAAIGFCIICKGTEHYHSRMPPPIFFYLLPYLSLLLNFIVW